MEKQGYKTTEFWMAAITNIVIAIIPLLVAYGVVSSEEGEMWKALIIAIAGPIIAIVMGFVASGYVKSRTSIKVEEARAEAMRPLPLNE